MFKFMLQFKTSSSLHIKNRQNLTPLTLAAYLARKNVNLKKLSTSEKPRIKIAYLKCGSKVFFSYLGHSMSNL
jgi:hypothetical protein